MSTNESLKDIFEKLVNAYDDRDEDEMESLTQTIKESGKEMRVVIDDDIEWEESRVEGYTECPIVRQSIQVFLGDELVYEGERSFGSELVDSTHTGLGGEWGTIRLDDEQDGIIELLEDFGQSVDDPDVPPWSES